MRKTNFTFLSLVLTMMVYLGSYSVSNAQCGDLLDCIDKVNISMPSGVCERTITPGDVMPPNAAIACAGATVMVVHKYTDPSPTVTIADLGWDLVYKVIDPLTQNSCWGYIRVEDKAPPRLISASDTVPCIALDETVVRVASDNCATNIYGTVPKITFISKRWIDYPCDSAFAGIVIRNYRAIDLWNNSATMTDTLWVERLDITRLICPPDTAVDCSKIIDLGSGPVDILWSSLFVDGPVVNGVTYRVPKPTKGPNSYNGNNPTQCREAFPAPGVRFDDQGDEDTAYMVDALGSNGKCNIVWKYTDMVIPTCGAGYKIRRVWDIYDWCTGTDTTCIQWIKITDTSAPYVPYSHLAGWTYRVCTEDPSGTLTECNDGPLSSDAIAEYEKPYGYNTATSGNGYHKRTRYKATDTRYPLYKEEDGVSGKSADEYFILHHRGEAYVNPHECSAHVTFPDFKSWLQETSCKKKVSVFYTVEYDDPSHPGKVITQHGEITKAGQFIYLPAGWHCVLITYRDDCWNESYYWWTVGVYDNTPPTPVCDRHTVVTLDPAKCWARVYAKDLDDGSHDNCCQDLHFAVAQMDSVEYWTEYWEGVFHDCLGQTAYYKHKADGSIDAAINEWINCFVFHDFVDVTDCGDETLVLRVYEVCGAPHYDPHLFKGTEHQWYCWNLSDNFACWYAWNYDIYSAQYNARPRPDMYCDYEGGYFDYGWEVPYGVNGPICTPNDYPSVHTPYHNDFTCSFESASCDPSTNDALWKNWSGRVSAEDRALLFGLKNYNRYWFKHLWNDCMVDINKQDKVAPVCTAPADATVYCDFTPYHGSMKVGIDTYEWWGADDAWLFCKESDGYPGNDGRLCDKTAQTLKGAGPWCFAKGPFVDAYGVEHGDYSCVNGHADYTTCPGYAGGAQLFAPIYCRLWLMLDQFEDGTGARIDPDDYLGSDDDVEVVECSGYTITHDDSGTLNECGVGTITRTWTVTENCEPGRSTYCYQKVTVKGRSDFEVCFPEDLLLDCEEAEGLTPDELGSTPEVSDDDCELIGINYEDQEFDIQVDEGQACRKIVRTWTIIDWCVYNPDATHRRPDVVVDCKKNAGLDRECVYRSLKDDGDGYMKYIQIIKIYDGAAPEVTANELEDGIITGGTGGSGVNGSTGCDNVAVERDLGSAEDGCAGTLRYRWTLTGNGVSLKGTGTTMKATLGIGTYTVTLYATDGCGNEGSATTSITIKETKAPTPFCYNGIATVIMPSTGEVTVWAKDLDAGSFDNCPGELRFTFGDGSGNPVHPDDDPTFDEDQNSGSRTFTCDELGQQTVQIWVWDSNDNGDFCETYLLIQPGINACQGSATASINGAITTENTQTVEFVNVKATSASNGIPAFKTGVDGKFAFSSVKMNSDYVINAERNDDAANGVSTLDIVAIQKHILGLEKLNSPYKVIAADIDRSNNVTAVDVVHLRKLVLGIYEQFPSNTSWRFVDKNYTFADAQNPWGFAEAVTIKNVSKSVEANFVGVKVGDVNNSSKANSAQLQGVVNRDNNKLTFQIDEQVVAVGQEVKVNFHAKGFAGVEGYQFTLNTSNLEVTNIIPGAINVTADNFGVNKNGAVRTSWSEGKGVNVTEGEILFTITAVAKEAGSLSRMLSVTSNLTNAEAYVAGDVAGIALEFVKGGVVVAADNYNLYQNNPNPFNGETVIGFVMPNKGDATMKIMDVTGKVLKVINGEFNKGYNEIKVAKKELGSAGVLYYQLESGEFVATKKMVLID